MRIGMLTGGGDCPGLNAVIRAVVRDGIDGFGDQLVGFRDGWRGVLEGSYIDLDIEATRGILPRGGTILGSSRTNPYKRDDGVPRVRETLAQLNLDALIAIGGEDTLGVANKLHQEGVNLIGVPKTIDNDLGATDVTFGFDTALQIATEAIDRLHTTAESHNRILVVEVMGRSAGWIALHSGIAGGADVILIPEIPFDIGEVCRLIDRRHARGRYFSVVVAAEGATPKAGTMEVLTGTVDEFRPSPAGRDRRPPRAGDRETHRVRDPGHGARPRAAWGNSDCIRPRARDQAGPRRDPGRARQRVGDDDLTSGQRDQARAAG
jgi:ATP-dependent phosphofructokinase / diphosphate-dependent phosphofructokinase